MINGFTVKDKKRKYISKRLDDSFLFKRKNGKIYIAVADGVSRDDHRQLHAKNASKLFCDSFINSESVRAGFERANVKIKKYNGRYVPDPNGLKEDRAGCVAAGVIIDGNELSYGFITDCGVAVISSNGKVKVRTENEYWKTDNPRWKYINSQEMIRRADIKKDNPGDKAGRFWADPAGRFISRWLFRNRPGQRYSYGVLTGENTAMKFVKYGSTRLSKGDIVLVYSDGLEGVLFSGNNSLNSRARSLVIKRDFDSLKSYCQKNVDAEGTVVYYVHE